MMLKSNIIPLLSIIIRNATPRSLGHLYSKHKAVLNDVFYTHRAEYIKNQ